MSSVNNRNVDAVYQALVTSSQAKAADGSPLLGASTVTVKSNMWGSRTIKVNSTGEKCDFEHLINKIGTELLQAKKEGIDSSKIEKLENVLAKVKELHDDKNTRSLRMDILNRFKGKDEAMGRIQDDLVMEKKGLILEKEGFISQRNSLLQEEARLNEEEYSKLRPSTEQAPQPRNQNMPQRQETTQVKPSPAPAPTENTNLDDIAKHLMANIDYPTPEHATQPETDNTLGSNIFNAVDYDLNLDNNEEDIAKEDLQTPDKPQVEEEVQDTNTVGYHIFSEVNYDDDVENTPKEDLQTPNKPQAAPVQEDVKYDKKVKLDLDEQLQADADQLKKDIDTGVIPLDNKNSI